LKTHAQKVVWYLLLLSVGFVLFIQRTTVPVGETKEAFLGKNKGFPEN